MDDLGVPLFLETPISTPKQLPTHPDTVVLHVKGVASRLGCSDPTHVSCLKIAVYILRVYINI